MQVCREQQHEMEQSDTLCGHKIDVGFRPAVGVCACATSLQIQQQDQDTLHIENTHKLIEPTEKMQTPECMKCIYKKNATCLSHKGGANSTANQHIRVGHATMHICRTPRFTSCAPRQRTRPPTWKYVSFLHLSRSGLPNFFWNRAPAVASRARSHFVNAWAEVRASQSECGFASSDPEGLL